MELINSSKPCPSCHAVLWREHLQESFKIPEVLSICKKLQSLIYEEDEEISTKEVPQQVHADVNTYVFDSVPPEKPETYEETEDVFNDGKQQPVEDFSNNNNDLVKERHQFTVLKDLQKERKSTRDRGKLDELTINVDAETNEVCEISPLESPPISSQFSNIVTKSEIKKGVQRNPRRLIKPPKVSYTRHKKPVFYSEDEEDDTDSRDMERVTVGQEVKQKKISKTRQRQSVEAHDKADVRDKDKEGVPVENEIKPKKITRTRQRKSCESNEKDGRDKNKVDEPVEKEIKSKKVSRTRQKRSVEFHEEDVRDKNETSELFQQENMSRKNTRTRQRKSVDFHGEDGRDKEWEVESATKESLSKKVNRTRQRKSVETHKKDDRDKGEEGVSVIKEIKPKTTFRNRQRKSVEFHDGSENDEERDDEDKKEKRLKPMVRTASNDDDKYSIFDFPSQPLRKDGADEGDYDNRTLHEITKSKKTKKVNPERKRKSSTENMIKDKTEEILKSERKSLNEKPEKTKKAQIEKKNKKGETPLHAACIKGNIEKVKDLLEQGALTNTKDFAGWTPLVKKYSVIFPFRVLKHEACNLGFKEIVVLLLDYGAIIDVVAGDDNDTPLHDAVSNNQIEVVKVLLNRNAPHSLRNRLGLLPIDYAGTEEMKELFERTTEQSNTSVLDESRFDESNMQEEKVLVTTNIKNSEKSFIEKCCSNLGGRLVRDFDTKVTHLICGTTEDDISISRTLKYWYGILNGRWLVSYKWVDDSFRENKWLREADYEVKGTIEAPYGIPRKARINSFKMLPKLFDGCSFYLAGTYEILAKDVIVDLIKLGGGKILSREPKTSDVDPLLTPITSATTKLDILPTHIQPTVIFHAKDTSSQTCCTQYIIYDEKSQPAYTRIFSPVLCSTTVSWLLDCISNFEILDIKENHYSEDIHSSQS